MKLYIKSENHFLTEVLEQIESFQLCSLEEDADIVVFDSFSSAIKNFTKPTFVIKEKYNLNNLVTALNQFIHNLTIVIADNIVIKMAESIITNQEKSIELSQIEIMLLRYLSQSKRIVPKLELLKNIWKYNELTETYTVENTISRLRKKISELGIDIEFTGEGYRIVAS